MSRIPTDTEIAAHLERDEPLADHGSADVQAAIVNWIERNPEAVAEIRRRKIAQVEADNRRAMQRYEREQNEFNRKIKERRVALDEARPVVHIIADAQLTQRGIAVTVQASVGRGPGPIDEYFMVHRVASKAIEFHGGWSQWMADRKPHQMPFSETLYLARGQDHEVSVIGKNRFGRVEAIPVRVSLRRTAEQEHTPPQVQDAPQPTNSAPPSREHRTLAAWVLCWDSLPGISPDRGWGSLAAATIPNMGKMGEIRDLFLMDASTLRLQLPNGTPADAFPDRLLVERAGKQLMFSGPGIMQVFGHGNARDYFLGYGSAAEIITAGADSTVTLVWN